MSVGTTVSRASTVSASMNPMPGISHPEIRAADSENFDPRPRPPVAIGGRTQFGSLMSVGAGQVVAVSATPAESLVLAPLVVLTGQVG
jgi:hypothetical protein